MPFKFGDKVLVQSKTAKRTGTLQAVKFEQEALYFKIKESNRWWKEVVIN